MTTLMLGGLLVVLVLIALAMYTSSFQSLTSRYIRWRDNRATQNAQAAPGETVTVVQGDEEIEVPRRRYDRASSGERPASNRRWPRQVGNWRRPALFAVFALVAVALIWQLPGVFLSSRDRFIVLVAPFADPDGTVSQGGRTVAQQLVEVLPALSGNRVEARLMQEPPPADNLGVALQTLAEQDADAFVWGQISAGGLLNQESLLPVLAYRPTGRFAPNGWAGYRGRFAMPTIYTLAGSELNGQAVLPTLLGGLADYSNGNFQRASDSFDQVQVNYNAVDTTLMNVLRGNMLWARGEYNAALESYRLVGADTAVNARSPQMGLLVNNYGVIEHDAGQDARGSLQRAGSLLQNQDSPELRTNWGIEQLRAGNADEAITSFTTARSLYGAENAPPALLIAMAEAYRTRGLAEKGDFDEAEQLLLAASRQDDFEASLSTPDQREAILAQIRAAVREEQGLLTLARALNTGKSLLWEIRASRNTPSRTLNTARDYLEESVESTNKIIQNWQRASAANDASGDTAGGMIASGQARRTQADLRERQRYLAMTQIEIGRTQVQNRRGIASIWNWVSGDRSQLGQARAQLTDLTTSDPADVEAELLLGIAYLETPDQLDKAQDVFVQTAQRAPNRPEPVYGQALVAIERDNKDANGAATTLLNQSLQLDPNFFPARQQLATLAEAKNDWATAIAQRRWIAEHRPSTNATLELARTLRESGESGYAEAEQLLLPLANQNSVPALLELNTLYGTLNKPDASVAVLERARFVAPRDPEVALELGNARARQGNADDAEGQYKRAIEARDDYVDAYLALGNLYSATGRQSEAATQYQRALNAGANDLDQLKQIGAVLLANERYSEALTAYERAADTNAGIDDAAVHHGLGQANLGLNRLEQAATEEQRAIELNGQYPDALIGLGDVRLKQNRPADAIDLYKQAQTLDGNLPAMYLGLGRANGAQGNWTVALDYFRQARQRYPNMPETHLWMGEALIRQPDSSAGSQSLQEAINEYNAALTLRPNYPQAYFGLAQAQAADGLLVDADQNLTKALQQRPDYAEALLLRGKINEQQQQQDQAIDNYSRSIRADNTIAESYYRRGLIYLRTDRVDDARSDMERAVRLQENFPEAHYWLGRTYLVQQRTEQARTSFARAVELRGGNYPEARYYQGVAEEQLGQRDEAITSFRVVVQQVGGGPWITEAQAALTRLGATAQ